MKIYRTVVVKNIFENYLGPKNFNSIIDRHIAFHLCNRSDLQSMRRSGEK